MNWHAYECCSNLISKPSGVEASLNTIRNQTVETKYLLNRLEYQMTAPVSPAVSVHRKTWYLCAHTTVWFVHWICVGFFWWFSHVKHYTCRLSPSLLPQICRLIILAYHLKSSACCVYNHKSSLTLICVVAERDCWLLGFFSYVFVA